MKVFILLFLHLIGAFTSAEEKIPGRIARMYKKPDIGLVTFSLHDPNKLVKLDKQRMLDIHNALRNYLALGKEAYSSDGHGGYTRMPTGADMQAMSWDDNLATYAQNWANKQLGSKHSDLKNDPLLKDYDPLGFLAESLSGDISAQERDMYGEVKNWNYENFACNPGTQCGHYLAFANAQYNHLGCGFKKYKNEGADQLLMVCVYGGNNPTAKERHLNREKWQHEYIKGKPCSECQQGWDYCMGGGLCATKKQCESYSGNHCKCLHDRDTCSGNGGTFNEDDCTCTCPADKMGINCAKSCANTNPKCFGCTKNAGTKYLCEKDCKSCGKSRSAAFEWTFVERQAPNSMGIMTRWKMEDPDKKAASTTPKGKPYCKNRDGDSNCEKLKVRGYCSDMTYGSMVRSGCKLSCQQTCTKPGSDGPTEADFKALGGLGGGGSGSTSAVSGDLAALLKNGAGSLGGTSGGSLPLSGTSGGSGAAKLNALSMADMAKQMGIDMSKYSAMRRRRR